MKIGIIGGGIMGLTLAWRLAKAGHEVKVLEAADRLGGLTTWFDYGDFVWDKYYHVVLQSDDHLLKLFDQLDMLDKLQWVETKTGFLWNNQLHSMSNHWEFLKFPAINLWQKFRLAAGLLYSEYRTKQHQLESVTAVDWLKSVFGEKVYATMWQPLLRSKYGILMDKVPASIMWSIIHRYYSTRNKGDGKERMGFFPDGGYKQLFDALHSRIKAHDGMVYCNQSVKNIDMSQQEAILIKTNDQEFRVDRLISTVPSTLLNRMAPQVTGLYKPHDYQPEFLGVIRLALILKQELSPYYVTNLIQPGFSFTGIIGLSSLTGTQEMAGKHFVMIPRYDVPSSEWFSKSDTEITDQFIREIKTVWPGIESNIENCFLHKEKIVQALWTKSPPEVSLPRRSTDGRMWSVNAELAGRDTLNNNAIVGVVDRVTPYILKHLN